MTDTFPKIEDIVDGLTADLWERGFSRVAHKPVKECVRYEKIGSPIGFQVGLEQDYAEQEEPEFNHVYLFLGFSVPGGIPPQTMEDQVLPNPSVMHSFFRSTAIYHQSKTYSKSAKIVNGRIRFLYHIGFEKSKATAPEMKAVLREAVDYFCNHITANVQMYFNTQNLQA